MTEDDGISKQYWLIMWRAMLCDKISCDAFGCHQCRYDGNPLVIPKELKP